MIRPVRPDDAIRICEIYNYYVAKSTITFEEVPVDVAEMEQRIAHKASSFPWYVAEEDGGVLGYSYAGTWRERSAYRFTVESTVYVAQDRHGAGIGSALYTTLVDELAKRGFRMVLGVVALPNDKSVRLHERLGFRKAGELHEVGYKFGRWIDIGMWELRLTNA